MTDFLKQIETGKKQKPRRVLFYGTHGVGKSTWASQAPEPIFIQTEDGLDDIGASRFPLAGHLSEVMDMLRELYGSEHKYKTLIIDSLDWLERLVWEAVCQEKNCNAIDDGRLSYGKGYQYAIYKWEEIKVALDFLRSKKLMHIILISHSKVEKYNNPTGDDYDRYSPKLNKKATSFWCEWADEVFFSNFKINVLPKENPKSLEKQKAVGEGRRVVYTNERPAYLAKNRLGIKDNIEMTWEAYASYFTNNKKEKGK